MDTTSSEMTASWELLDSLTTDLTSTDRPEPDNNRGAGLISDVTLYWFEVICYIVLCGSLSIIGICTNIINMIIFYRQEPMSESCSMSLLGLAVADFCCLVTMLWLSINYVILFTVNPSDLPWDPMSVQFITAGWPRVMFTRVNCWITAFVALERCICVTFPFKVKILFTPKRSLCVIIAIFVIIISSYIPIFYTHRLQMGRLPGSNDTKLILVYAENKAHVETIFNYINDITLPTICLIFVMVCTKITISRLHSSSQWRKGMKAKSKQDNAIQSRTGQPQDRDQHHHQQQERGFRSSNDAKDKEERPITCLSGVAVPTTAHPDARFGDLGERSKQQNLSTASSAASQKEKKVTRMVTLICIIFLVTYIPAIFIIYLRLAIPEIGNGARYHNLFHAIYSADFVLETFNYTINIFVYATMSSRYKLELKKLFSFRSRQRQ